jgi:hypothetical protein
MKKQLFITTLMLLMISATYSQTTSKMETKKFNIGLSTGFAFPVAFFKSKDYNHFQDPGFAKTGFNINLEGSYHIIKNFGIASKFMFSNFGVDEEAAKRYLPISVTPSSTDHWQYFGILAGPMGTIDLGDNFSMDVKGLVGYARANAPVLKFNLEEISGITLATSDKWSDAFAWQLGTDFKYKFANNFNIFTNIDYSYMKPRWSFDLTAGGSKTSAIVHQRMSVIDVNLGVGVDF